MNDVPCRKADAYEQSIIEEAIRHDRRKLFSLADQVGKRAVMRCWDTLIVDGGRGMLVGEFLLHILRGATIPTGSNAPNMITVANSRDVASFGYRRQHRRSALQYMRDEGIGKNALIVTDMVDSGRNIRRLNRYASALGVRSDFAILTTPASENDLRRMIKARPSSEVYFVQHNKEPYLARDDISQGLGLYTIAGNAHMQPHPYHWDWLEQPIRNAFHGLAAEYIEKRQTD